jgi:hypothetical protein
VAGVGRIDGHLGIEAGRVRQIVDDADGACHGAGAIERTLWAAQHLDPLDVGEVEIHEHRHFVDVGGYQWNALPRKIRRGDRIIRIQAADDDVAVAAVCPRAQVRYVDAGDEAGEIGQAGDIGGL